jgi:SAM-dependent methyltransferase
MLSLQEWWSDMDYSFPHYLLSKQSVDDRALNRSVVDELKGSLPGTSLKVIEVGAGIGSMLRRLLRWNILKESVDYTMVDLMSENTDFAHGWLPEWAVHNGCKVDLLPGGDIRLNSNAVDVQIHFVPSDVFDFINLKPDQADLLIAHALLDLLPLPQSLSRLLSLVKPGGLAWLAANFDGVTSFEPLLDPALDSQIESLFHKTMDERITNGTPSGDSRTGRHLFSYLEQAGATIVAAGASDWVVFPVHGRYPADEANFLRFILHFFETSLSSRPELDAGKFSGWLAARQAQIDRGELVYIAHQLDFLVRV